MRELELAAWVNIPPVCIYSTKISTSFLRLPRGALQSWFEPGEGKKTAPERRLPDARGSNAFPRLQTIQEGPAPRRQAEKVLVAATLEHTDGCISKAAAILGIDRSTLYAKIKRYGLSSRHP
jgi:DNA-binding NtrC family response regulator